MKKYLLVVLCAAFLFAVTGCGGKKQVVCTKTEEEDGQKITMQVSADLDKSDKITDVSITYDFGDKEMASTYCELFKSTSDKSDAVTCDGSKITIKGADNFDEEDETEDSEKIVGKAKADFVKEAEEEGFTCK
jgi:hypothetical protein